MKLIIWGPVLWDSIWGHGQELARILAEKHEVIYLEPVVHSSKLKLSFQRTAKNPIPENVTVVKRDTSLGLNILYGLYVEILNVLYLRKTDYDIFLTYYTICGLFATIFSRLKGKKVILMYVDDLSELYGPKTVKFLTKFVFTPLIAKFSNSIVVTAHKLKESIEKYGKVEYIPNGVNLKFFRNEKVFKKKQNLIVGFVGAFGNWIDFKMVLGAAKLLKNHNIKFLFIGNGEEYKVFKKKIEELHLKNIILKGLVPHFKVPEVLGEMDICIIPFKTNSLTDSISPVKLFEYWAMGKPVISTSFYEMKKIAKDKVIFADSPKELKNAILSLKNDVNLRRKYEELGFNEVKNYDWNVLAEKYFELIENL